MKVLHNIHCIIETIKLGVENVSLQPMDSDKWEWKTS